MADQPKGGTWLSWLKGNADWMMIFGLDRYMRKAGGSGESDPLKSADDEYAFAASFTGLKDGTPLGEARYRMAVALYDFLNRTNRHTLPVRLRQLLSRVRNKEGKFDPDGASKLFAQILGCGDKLDENGKVDAATKLRELIEILSKPSELETQFEQLTNTLEIGMKSPAAAAVQQRWEQFKQWNRKEDERGAAAVQKLLDDDI